MPKTLKTPNWAQDGRSVIGYTCKMALTGTGFVHQIQHGQLNAPSVYYQKGHTTVDHGISGNIGWDGGDGWKWLFFGNVPQHVAFDPKWKHRSRTDRTSDAKELLKKYDSYYVNGRFQNVITVCPTDWVLVEIWDRGNKIDFHPSRNMFRWASPQIAEALHKYATDPVTKPLTRSASAAKARRRS